MAIRNGAFPEIPDDELVLIALLGNMASFDELVRRYRGAVIRVAHQVVGSRTAAEDVAQDAFLLAYKALPQLQDPANFAGWIYAITRHRARRVAGREGRSETVDLSDLDRLILDYCPEMTLNPAEEVLRRSERALIPTALRSLPQEHRIAMELRYFEEWPVARIAEFLSLPVTTVKWRLHTGRQMMRRYLTREPQTAASSESDRERAKETLSTNERKRYGRKARKTPAA
jgi:RNA polymerase sigma-70 factor (ECF subfamily)